MAVLKFANTRLKIGNFKLAQKKERLGCVWFNMSVSVDGVKAFNPKVFPYGRILTDARHIEGLISVISKALAEYEAVCWRPDDPDILVCVSPDDWLYGGVSLDEDGNPLDDDVGQGGHEAHEAGYGAEDRDPSEDPKPDDVFKLEITLDPEGLLAQSGLGSGVGIAFRVSRKQLSDFVKRLDREFNSVRALYAIQKLEA